MGEPAALPLRASPRAAAPRSALARATMLEALVTGWHGDAPPTGASGDYRLDMRLADAFRMLVYVGDDDARLRWIERQVSDPAGKQTGDPYRAALIGWWMAIFEAQAT
jgi:hypothetical protein